MLKLSRRHFMKTASAASTVFPLITIAGTRASGRVIGANERVRVAVAGLGTRGKTHLETYTAMPDVEVTYLVDPDTNWFESRSELVMAKGSPKPRCVQDVRKALEDPNLDVISIAAPNHWHTLMTIWACQAGKDVYVEKPLSHNLLEGRRAVEAARKYCRVIQHGTQKRSEEKSAALVAAVQSGKYGKLLVAAGRCYKPRKSIGFKQPMQPPANLDFDLWLGPVAEQPYHQNLVHYNWHWFWDTGNGDLGNQGIHELDVARWGIKGATLPRRVWSLGGRFAFNDQGQTPNTQLNVFDFGGTPLLFEVRNAGPTYDCSNRFYMEEGLITNDCTFHPKNGGSAEPIAIVDHHVHPGGHFGNFVNSVKRGKPEELNCDVLEGHYSASACHLANISYRLGNEVSFDEQAKSLGDDKYVLETLDGLKAHLRDEVHLPLDSLKYRLGRTIEFDPQSEKCVNDAEANSMLTCEYRTPFVVPNQV